MLRPLICAAAALLTVSTAHAQDPLIPEPVAGAVRSAVQDGDRMGVVVGYWRDGQSDFYAWGTTAADGVPVGPDTLFETGSITKVFTGELLAALTLSGDAGLDTPLSDIWPGAALPYDLTLGDLATHTGGLPRDIPLAALQSGDDEDLLAAVPPPPLDRTPTYSSVGMALLARAMEIRTGTPLERLLGRITGPAGLRSTAYHPVDRARLARPHIGRTGIGDTRPDTVGIGRGAGGLYSTPRDLLRFAVLHLPANRQPRTAFMQVALAGHRDLPLGWQVHEVDGQRIYHHSGEAGGYQTFMGFREDDGGTAVVLMSNSSVDDDLQAIALHLLDPAVPLPTFDRTGGLSSADVEYLAGTYAVAEDPEGNRITLVPVDSGLGYVETAPDGTRIRRARLEVVGPGDLRIPGTPIHIRFAPRPSGPIQLVVGGQTFLLVRLAPAD